MKLELPDKHTQIVLEFSGGGKLFFNDMRRFGYMQLATDKEVVKVLARFGIEPLTDNFKKEDFRRVFKNRKTNLKALLLNQQLIAGIGNIYADEICWLAKVRPERTANSLTKKELDLIHKCTEDVIKKAIAFRGTTFNNYVDAGGNKGNFTKLLKVYGRGGKLCKGCKKEKIKKVKLVGRGTHYCPVCQK